MALLIIFTVIGSITTLLGLFFFGLRIVETITIELKTFSYKVDKTIKLKKEGIDEKLITKKERNKQLRDKQDELKDIKNSQKIDKVETKILLEKTKKETVKKEGTKKTVKKVTPKKVEPKKEVIVEQVEVVEIGRASCRERV